MGRRGNFPLSDRLFSENNLPGKDQTQRKKQASGNWDENWNWVPLTAGIGEPSLWSSLQVGAVEALVAG